MTQGRGSSIGRTIVALGIVGLATLGVAGRAGAQQVPYDAGKTLIVLGTATADDQGNVTADITLPPEITDGYEVIAAGIAAEPTDTDVPYSVLATISEDWSGVQQVALGLPAAGLADGETAAALLPTVTDPTISASATGFRPNSEVRFSVRYSPANASTPTAAGGIPRTGTDILPSVLIGLVALAVGSALVVTAVNHRRRVRSA